MNDYGGVFINEVFKGGDSMDRKKILVVDDEEEFVALLKVNLELTDFFSVDVAMNGKDALKMAKKISRI